MLATIIVERGLDLVAVWAATMVLVATGLFTGIAVVQTTGLTVGLAALLFLIALATSRSGKFRRAVWRMTSLFNSNIQLVMLDTLWSTLEVFREARARWARILLQSVVMWGLYGLSFALLARALELELQQVFMATVGSPLQPMIVPLLRQGGDKAVGLVLFSFAPVILFLAYIGAKQLFGFSVWGAVSWMHNPTLYDDSAPRSKSRFLESEHYGDFLSRQFQGTNDLVSDFEGNALRDIVVQRMLRGGSDALTVMVQLRDQLCIRKYASGGAADKLEAQCAWLEQYSNLLPTVHIQDRARAENRFFYDMEYSRTSRDLFDMVHTYDVESSWNVLSDVLNTMSDFHENTSAGDADDMCTTRYAAEKVAGNLKAIKEAVPEFFDQPSIVVNGVMFDLRLLDRFAETGFRHKSPDQTGNLQDPW